MGASNSTAQTAHIVNPTARTIQVTPSVVNRLETARNIATLAQNGSQCSCNCTCTANENCSNQKLSSSAIQTSGRLSALQLKYNELQENQYLKTMEKLESMLGKPIRWAEHCEADLKLLRKKLIKCHSDYPTKPLECATVAKQFKDFVFQEQYKTILKAKNIKVQEGQ